MSGLHSQADCAGQSGQILDSLPAHLDHGSEFARHCLAQLAANPHRGSISQLYLLFSGSSCSLFLLARLIQ